RQEPRPPAVSCIPGEPQRPWAPPRGMSRRPTEPFARCRFLPYSQRRQAPAGARVIDVSSYADPPFHQLSPFYAHGGIPVPGMPGTVSDSVEGIWQGLKVIRGATAPRLFSGGGRKRGGGKPSGHRLGRKLLGILEARYKISLPAYEWALEHRVDPALIEGFVTAALAGVVQLLHDTEDNGDPNNPSAPLAHAAVLARYVNRLCEARHSMELSGGRAPLSENARSCSGEWA